MKLQLVQVTARSFGMFYTLYWVRRVYTYSVDTDVYTANEFAACFKDKVESVRAFNQRRCMMFRFGRPWLEHFTTVRPTVEEVEFPRLTS